VAVSEQTWIIDKSALARLAVCIDPDLWSNRIQRGLVRISNVTRLKIDPDNALAKNGVNLIEDVYRSMGRLVPQTT
jgi:hypothetical protein